MRRQRQNNLPSSVSFALTEFAGWRCHLQSGLWLVSIYNISMVLWYYELLKPIETITGTVYRTQLMRLSRALKEKRVHYYSRHDKVILLHDNTRPHVAAPVKTYLETLKWEVWPHSSYSPDIAPSDLHLFRSMTHGLSEQHFTSY